MYLVNENDQQRNVNIKMGFVGAEQELLRW